MAFGATPRDSGSIPLGCVYVPNVGLIALQGGVSQTDGSANASAAVVATNVDGQKTTYAAAITGGALAATPTNIFTLTGSATRTIKLVKLALTLHCTALATTLLVATLNKLSSALTGGTPVALTMVPMDSNSAAATALAQNWTANSTGGGTLVGSVAGQSVMPIWAGAQTATDFPSPALPQVVFDYGLNTGQQPTLRGVAQVMSLSLNSGTLVATTTYDAFMVWTEDSYS